MMKIRKIGYNKRKMLLASHINSEFEFPQSQDDADDEMIDVSRLEPMRSNRHVFVSHLIRINQIKNGTIESFGDENTQK